MSNLLSKIEYNENGQFTYDDDAFIGEPNEDDDTFFEEPNDDEDPNDDDIAMRMQKRMNILTGSRFSRNPKEDIRYVVKHINNLRDEDEHENDYKLRENNDDYDYYCSHKNDDGIDHDEKPVIQFRLSRILSEIRCDETFNEIKEKLEGTGRFTKSANKK
jgi:hypothetical protein